MLALKISLLFTSAEVSQNPSGQSKRQRGKKFICSKALPTSRPCRTRGPPAAVADRRRVGTSSWPGIGANNRVLAGPGLHGLGIIFRDGIKYKKAGIMLMDLRPDTLRQGVMFDAAPDRARSVRAMAALDALNERFGRDTVHLGSAGLVRRWAMLSENRTPRYTTNWMELPKVRAH